MGADPVEALERRRAELLAERRQLRAEGAPPARLVPVVQALDDVEAELRSAQALPAATERDELRWRDALLVGAAAVVVAALASGGAALVLGGGSSRAAKWVGGGVVHARLRSALSGTSCSATTTKAALTWTWTLDGSGHDGETAMIRAHGPGLARTYRVPVTSGRVRLARTSPCEPTGTQWRATLVRVGSRPARLAP